MALFTQDSIERVRDAVDMVELVGAQDRPAPGRAAAGRASARSTTSARRRSRSTPRSKLYHCFGCEKGGDAIGFVQEIEALDFPEAVELLAERYNVRRRARGRGSRGREAPAAARAAAGPARPHRALLRALPRELRRGRQGARLPGRARASRRRCCASSASATRRAPGTGCWWAPSATASRRRSCWPRASPSATDSGNLYDRFRGRIMFPLADAARPRARLRRPRDVGGARRRST